MPKFKYIVALLVFSLLLPTKIYSYDFSYKFNNQEFFLDFNDGQINEIKFSYFYNNQKNYGIIEYLDSEIEITISTRDVHGNIAPASDIQFEFDDPLGSVSPSSTGDGHWIIEGGEVGEWNLRLSAGSATQDIVVEVYPGQPVRLLAEIPEQNPEEGGKMIMRIHAIDQAGNRIEVPHQEVTIKCTTGGVEHLAGDTYEVSIDQSGQSQSCNVFWNDLVAQRFFDVDAVLFGGGLGDSNTALTLVSIIVFLFVAIMFVLIRRVKGDQSDDYEWEGEFIHPATSWSGNICLQQPCSDFSWKSVGDITGLYKIQKK